MKKLFLRLYPEVRLERNECIGVLGGWDVEVKWLKFKLKYRTTEMKLKNHHNLMERLSSKSLKKTSPNRNLEWWRRR